MSCSRGCCESFKEHVRSVAVSAAATPTRRVATNAIEATERQWQVDGDAYKRLRRDGLQPNDIDGSAHLEKTLT